MTQPVAGLHPIPFQLTIAGAVSRERIAEFRPLTAEVIATSTTFRLHMAPPHGPATLRRLLAEHGLVALSTRRVDLEDVTPTGPTTR